MPPSPHAEDDTAADMNEETVQTHRSRKRRKQQAPQMVFGESGLTTEERRETRMQQRTLYEHLETTTAPEQLKEIAEQNNAIFKRSVKFSREAVLDADNLHLIARKYEQYAESLVSVPRFDAGKFMLKLKHKCSSDGRFNWNSFGKEAVVCFNGVPERVVFLCGPLGAEPTMKKKKERKERRKQEVDLVEAVKPKEVEEGEQEGDPNKLSATEKTIKQMEKQLKKRVKENHNAGLGPKIDGSKYLCNPQSFTQTVENIFHFSFLIKKGQASIGVADEAELGGSRKRGLYVGAEKPEGDSDVATNKQAVLTFTMRDWRAMCEGISEGDLPHRESA